MKACAAGAAAALALVLASPIAAIADDDYLTDDAPIVLQGGDTQDVVDMALAPDGSRAYVMAWGDLVTDPSIQIVDLASGEVIGTEPVEDAGFGTEGNIEISPDGQTVYTVDVDGVLKVYNVVDSGLELASSHDLADAIGVSKYSVADMAISHDGATMYFTTPGYFDDPIPKNRFVALDLNTFAPRAGYQPDTAPRAWNVVETPDGEHIVIRLIKSGEEGIQVISTSDASDAVVYSTDPFDSMAVSPDSKYLYTVDGSDESADRVITKIDLATGETIAKTVADVHEEGFDESNHMIAVSPDGSRVYVGFEDVSDNSLTQLAVLDSADLSVLTTRSGFAGEASNVAVTNSGDLYVSTDRAYIYDAESPMLYPFSPVTPVAPVEVSISADPSSGEVVSGQQVALTASATGGEGTYSYEWTDPTGSTSTGKTLTLDQASVTMSGDFQLTVTDSEGNSDTATFTLTVNPAETSTAVAANPASVDIDGTVDLKATVSATDHGDMPLTGTVSFVVTDPDGADHHVSGSDISDGVSTAQYADTSAAGDHTVVAKYSGDAEALESQSEEATFTVNEAEPEPGPIEIQLDTSDVAVAYGDGVTVAAQVSGGTAPLEYSWTNADGDRVGDSDTLQLENPQVSDSGQYTLTVTDANGETATTNVSVEITPAQSSVSAGVDSAEVTAGDDIAVTGHVGAGDGPASGEVTVTLTDADGETVATVTSPIGDGGDYAATIPAPEQAGDYVVAVAYAGNENVTGSDSDEVAVTVTADDSGDDAGSDASDDADADAGDSAGDNGDHDGDDGNDNANVDDGGNSNDDGNGGDKADDGAAAADATQGTSDASSTGEGSDESGSAAGGDKAASGSAADAGAAGTETSGSNGSTADAEGPSSSSDASSATEDPAELPATGSTSPLPWIAGVGGLVMLGGAAVLAARERRRA